MQTKGGNHRFIVSIFKTFFFSNLHIAACLEEYFKKQSSDQLSGGYWDEDGQMAVIQHDIPCPLCRQNIGAWDDWTPVDEVMGKMKGEMQQLEKRIQVSDKQYQERLKEKTKN